MADEETTFEGWAILELMGHRRLGGYVREVEFAGKGMLRIDVPDPDAPTVVDMAAERDAVSFAATQFYSPQALYCLTPTTEDVARLVAKSNRPEPVQRWELPAPATAGAERDDIDFG